MNIILGEDQYQALKDQYIILELDTLVINGDEIPSYCVLDAKSIPLDEMTQVLQHNRKLFYGRFAADCWHELKCNISQYF